MAIQVYGAEGLLSDDVLETDFPANSEMEEQVKRNNGHAIVPDEIQFSLARAWVGIRQLRFADGPDEVHIRSLAKLQLSKFRSTNKSKL
ncbi:hypothetical protein D3C80_1858120 [compost metagenome]